MSDELFYSANVAEYAWNENRLSFGLALPVKVTKKVIVNPEVFYLLQSKRNTQDAWLFNHIFGTGLKINF